MLSLQTCRHTILTFFLISDLAGWALTSAYGQSTLSTPSSPAQNSDNSVPLPPIEQSDDDDSEVEEVDDASAALLDDTQPERRGNKQFGVGLGLGLGLPWQTLSFSFAVQHTPQHFSQYYFGTGNFHSGLHEDSENMQIETKPQVAGAALDFYPIDFVPLFIRSFLQLNYWPGTIKFLGTDVAISSEDIRTNSFVAWGATIGGNIGFSYLFANGIYIENSLIDLSYSRIFSKRIDQDSKFGDRVLQKQLHGTKIFGFFNIKVGYMF